MALSQLAICERGITGLQYCKIIVWNSAGICLVLMLAEVVFGKWFWGDPLSNINVFRDIEWIYSAEQLYGRKDVVVYRRDKWGFRGGFADPAEIDILTVGGSTTDERFITEGETWTDRLGQCLRGAGYNLIVGNAGVTGQSTRGYLANFDLWFSQVRGLNPKYILAYIGINDTWALGAEAQYKDDVRRFNEEKNNTTAWAVWLQGVKMKSSLYRIYRIVKGQWTAIRAGIVIEPNFSMDQPADREFAAQNATSMKKSMHINSDSYLRLYRKGQVQRKPMLQNFRKNLLDFVSHVRGEGALPILVTQRWATYRRRGNVVYGSAQRYITQNELNNVTRQICQEKNLVCFDLATEIAFDPGDTYDVIHTTPKGSIKIAKYICKKWLDSPTLMPISNGIPYNEI